MSDLHHVGRASFLRHGKLALLAFLLLLTTFAAGVGLLSLSGHFLTAAALAGSTALAFNLFGPSAGIRALTFVRILSRYGEKLLSHDLTLRFARDLRIWFFARALPLAPLGLGRRRLGDLLTQLVADVESVDGLWVRAVAPLLALTGLTITVVVACAWVLPDAGLCLLLSTLGILASALIGLWRVDRIERACADARSRLRQAVQEGIEGNTDLVIWHALDSKTREIERRSHVLALAERRVKNRLALSTALQSIVIASSLVVLLWLVLNAVFDERVSGPVAAAVLFAGVAVFEAMAGTALAWQSLRNSLVALERLRQTVTPTATVETPSHSTVMPSVGTLVFDRVDLNWQNPDGSCRRVLESVDFTLQPGQRLVIHGDSGAGKSSLAMLLLRLRDPDGGAIRYGDVDLRAVAPEDWHQHIGWLPQDTHLFAGSVRDNLRIGDIAADDARLWWVLQQVMLDDVVRRLEGGLDAMLMEGGVNLSVGQARRMAIARMLLRRAAIMVLDEPTEGLDAQTAMNVLRNVVNACQNRSMLIISHDRLPNGLVDVRYLLREGKLQRLDACGA